jgi:hypothetical protein
MTAGDFSTTPGGYRLWLLSSYLQCRRGRVLECAGGGTCPTAAAAAMACCLHDRAKRQAGSCWGARGRMRGLPICWAAAESSRGAAPLALLHHRWGCVKTYTMWEVGDMDSLSHAVVPPDLMAASSDAKAAETGMPVSDLHHPACHLSYSCCYVHRVGPHVLPALSSELEKPPNPSTGWLEQQIRPASLLVASTRGSSAVTPRRSAMVADGCLGKAVYQDPANILCASRARRRTRHSPPNPAYAYALTHLHTTTSQLQSTLY